MSCWNPLRRWVATLLIATGCSGPIEDRLEVHTVHGTANYNGAPMSGASIVLVPETPSPLLKMPPFGRIESDGTFHVTSYGEGDGAPTGKYKATFTWSDGDPDSPSDLLGGRFSDPSRPVETITIEPGDNELSPFELRGPPIQRPASAVVP